MSNASLWFSNDPGMQFPRTQAEIARENWAQHRIEYKGGWSVPFCHTCNKAGSQLREPCALPIAAMDDELTRLTRESYTPSW